MKQKQFYAIFTFSILKYIFAYAIMSVTKKEIVSMWCKSENPREWPLWGFHLG